MSESVRQLAQHKYLKASYLDLIGVKQSKPSTRNAKQIVEDVAKKGGLIIV